MTGTTMLPTMRLLHCCIQGLADAEGYGAEQWGQACDVRMAVRFTVSHHLRDGSEITGCREVWIEEIPPPPG